MGFKEAKLRPLVVLVAVALVALGYLLSLLGNASADSLKYPGADCSAVACPVCSIASSNVQLDASTQNIEYFLALWNKWLASQVKGYNPGAHGITEPKYRGHKVQFFYNEMLTVGRNPFLPLWNTAQSDCHGQIALTTPSPSSSGQGTWAGGA
jgi:hypothetical protein